MASSSAGVSTGPARRRSSSASIRAGRGSTDLLLWYGRLAGKGGRMLEHFVRNDARVQRLRSSVIGPQVDSFTDGLTRLGFAVTTVRPKVSLLEQLSGWMVRRGYGVSDLSEQVVDRFLQDRRRRARLHRDAAATVRDFLAHLRAEGRPRRVCLS